MPVEIDELVVESGDAAGEPRRSMVAAGEQPAADDPLLALRIRREVELLHARDLRRRAD